MALMNMVSSNINQWTLLAAMLAIVFSWSNGAPSTIAFDEQQRLEILMTLGQSLIGTLFLINMELVWWEAGALFVLWLVQFALSPVPRNIGGFLFPLFAAAVAGLVPGAALAVGAVSYGGSFLAGLRMTF